MRVLGKTLKPASTTWLLANEMRLGWREMASKPGAARVSMIILGVVLLIVMIGAIPAGWFLRGVVLPINGGTIMIAAAAAAVIFTLMLSQTLAAATQALYARADLDLLFSSPLPPERVLTVRFTAIALNVFLGVGLFIAPWLIPIALISHPEWLSALVVLAGLALLASSAGLLLAMALFRVLGPRRTRVVAQVLGALIGAGFFLATQLGNLAGGRRGLSVLVVDDQRFQPDSLLALPLKAMTGHPLPLLGFILIASGLFWLTNLWLGRRFASNAAAATGSDARKVRASAGAGAFAAGAFAATVRKELRLLSRDAGLISQVGLRVLYMLPLAFVLLRNAGSHASYMLPSGAAALSFVAAQVAGSLAWITVSAEDAPDLLVSAPTPVSTFSKAKLTAALIPVAALLVIPLVGLIVLAPLAGVAATLGCAASCLATGLMAIWYQRPAKRAEFNRKGGRGPILATLAGLVVQALIGGATALTAMGLFGWALIPAALGGGLLLALRRSDAQILKVLRQAS